MKKHLPSLILAFAAIISMAAAVHAAPVQRIHEIKRPLFNVPAIVKAGGVFTLEIDTAGRYTLTSASLEPIGNPNVRIQLGLRKLTTDGNRVTYETSAASGTPEALYDLCAQFSDSKLSHDHTDYQPHAVKVVKKFRTEYDVIQLTDIHFNIQDIKGQDINRIRRRLLLDINRAKPEFVIFTGDLGLEPPTYDLDYVYGYDQLTQLLRVPVFMVPGNHEMYYDKTGDTVVDGAEYWKANYGPMYHSFDYGAMHFAGIADYECWAPKWRTRKSPDAMFHATVLNACMTDAQWKWLQDDLKAAHARGQGCIAYTHIPIETLQGGRKVGAPPFIPEGPTPEQMTSLLTASGCTHIFVGHNHVNKIETFGALTEVLTLGAGTDSIENKGKMGYRTIHIKNGKITSMKTHEIDFSDLK